jgi:hypothetical protein
LERKELIDNNRSVEKVMIQHECPPSVNTLFYQF